MVARQGEEAFRNVNGTRKAKHLLSFHAICWFSVFLNFPKCSTKTMLSLALATIIHRVRYDQFFLVVAFSTVILLYRKVSNECRNEIGIQNGFLLKMQRTHMIRVLFVIAYLIYGLYNTAFALKI